MILTCHFCRKPIALGRLYRMTLIGPEGETMMDVLLHDKCYAKTFEIRVLRKKAKQRIPLTTVFESVDPKEGS